MKTSCVSLVCPVCNTNYEIYLRKSPHIIVIECPACDSSLSCYNGQSIVVNEIFLEKLKSSSTQSAESLALLIDEMFQPRQETVSKEDVTDLKIALADCYTFDDVMRVICKK